MHNSPAIKFLLDLFRPDQMQAQLSYYTPEVLADIKAGQLEVRRTIAKLFHPIVMHKAHLAGSSADKAIQLIKLAKAKGVPEELAYDVGSFMAQLAESHTLFYLGTRDGELSLEFTGEYEVNGYNRLYRERYQPDLNLILKGINALCGNKEGSSNYKDISNMCLRVVNKVMSNK